jgi:uncharacterized protein YlxP (DUF503 family)
LTLLAEHCHSLKEKRSVVRKLKDRVRARFSINVAEVGGQDTWQRAVLGFSVVGIDRGHVESALDEVVRFVESAGLAQLYDDEREVLTFGDRAFAEEEARAEAWIPEAWREEEE